MVDKDYTHRSIHLYIGKSDTQLLVLSSNRVMIENAITKFALDVFTSGRQYFSIQGASIYTNRLYMEDDKIMMDIHLIENDDIHIDEIIRSGRFYLTGEFTCGEVDVDTKGKNPSFILSSTLESLSFKSVAFSDEKKYATGQKTLFGV